MTNDAPNTAPPAAAAAPRRRVRTLLLVVVPLVVAAGVGAGWLGGGRWISTDNAYVGAQKVLITPEVSGRVVSIAVVEGQKVAPQDVLLAVDPEPYRIALAGAEAKRTAAKVEHDTLVASVASLERQIALARETAELRRIDYDRKVALSGAHTASQSDVDVARIGSANARAAVEQLEQAHRTALAQLLGDPRLPLDRFPAHAAAAAGVDRAARDLAETTIRAPLAGIATQVASIQMGRYVNAGDAIFAVVGTERVWVDANPKETDLGHVRPGQPAEVSVDAFPGRVFHGRVAAISPGTGSQFSVLPAQNASGNWVKVVQRVPVRIELDPAEEAAGLRAGMSADVAIDTGHRRAIGDLFGRTSVTGSAVAAATAPSPVTR